MKKAFSLTELMVVLVVIATLLVLVSAGLAGGKAASKTTACTTNLRSLWQATHTIVGDDQKQRLPLSGAFPDLKVWDLPAATWICPFDKVSRAPKVSYDYVAGAFMSDYATSRIPNPNLQIPITMLYERMPDLPLFEEHQEYHPKMGRYRVDYNGSITRFTEEE